MEEGSEQRWRRGSNSWLRHVHERLPEPARHRGRNLPSLPWGDVVAARRVESEHGQRSSSAFSPRDQGTRDLRLNESFTGAVTSNNESLAVTAYES